MKRIDSEVLNQEWITLAELADLVYDLDQSFHIWLTLFTDNDDNQNYVQVDSQFSPKALKAEGVMFLSSTKENNHRKSDNESVFQLEARVYQDIARDIFRHYRIYTSDKDYIMACFKAYYNDSAFDYSQWQDVTAEF